MDFNKLSREEERPEDAEWFLAARKRVSRLGGVLMITAILCAVSNLGVLAVANALKQQNPQPQPPPNIRPENREDWERGRRSAPLLDFLCVGFVSLIYLPVLLGGLALQRGTGRGLGLTAAALVMLPCSPGFLLGMPVGIWALVVLNHEDVKTVLAHGAQNNRERDDELD